MTVETFTSLEKLKEQMRDIFLFGEFKMNISRTLDNNFEVDFIDEAVITLENGECYKSRIKLATLHLDKDNRVQKITHIYTEIDKENIDKLHKITTTLGRKIEISENDIVNAKNNNK